MGQSPSNQYKNQEAHSDSRDVPTSSFKRGSSTNNSKNIKKSIKDIIDAVEEIRVKIRSGQIKKEEYDGLQKILVGYSQQLNGLQKKGKLRDEIDRAQKLVSSATKELLDIQPTDTIDHASAIVSSTPKPTKTEKPNKLHDRPRSSNKTTAGVLDDIENKLEAVKSEIKVAEANKDKNQLFFLAKSVETLLTNLQMENVGNQLINKQRKEILENNLITTFREIEKIRKQRTTDSNINYLIKQQNQEKSEQCLQDLKDLEKNLIEQTRNINFQNFDTDKEKFNNYKRQFNSIEEINQEVHLMKSKVLNALSSVESALANVDKLIQIENNHHQCEVNFSRLGNTPDSESIKKHRQYLLQLKHFVKQITSELNPKVDDKKKYILYNIDNSLAVADQKIKDKEDAIKIATREEVILRKTTNAVPTQTLFEKLVSWSTEFEASVFSGNELENISKQLDHVKRILNKKMGKSEDYYQNNVDNFLAKGKIQKPAFSSNSSAGDQMENIVKEVNTSEAGTEHFGYTKESKNYEEARSKLAAHKTQPTNLYLGNEANRRYGENIVKHTDNVSKFLDKSGSNASNRKSTSDQILVDINSVSVRVNDLGSKIPGFNQTVQDYDRIKNGLLEHQYYLKNLQISPNYVNIYKFRDDVLLQIENHLSRLQNSRKSENSNTSENENKFNQGLRNLKQKVSRYSGSYKNVLYNTIEKDLNKCLNNVDNVFKDNHIALEVKKDIKNNIMILEQKAIKDRQYDSVQLNVQDPNKKKLPEIIETVESIKSVLNNPYSLTKEQLNKLEHQLTLCVVTLDSVKGDQLKQERKKVHDDINLCFSRIQELMVINERQPSFINHTSKQQLASPNIAKDDLIVGNDKLNARDSNMKKFAEVRKSVELVKSVLNQPNAPTNEQLDRLSGRLTLSVFTLDTINDVQLKEEKTKLHQDINLCSSRIQELMMLNKPQSNYRNPLTKQQIIQPKISAGVNRTAENVLNPNTKKFAEVRENVKQVNSVLKNPNSLSNEELDKLDGKLTLSLLTLDSIHDVQSKNEKTKLHQDVNLCLSRIQDVMAMNKVHSAVKNPLTKQQTISTPFKAENNSITTNINNRNSYTQNLEEIRKIVDMVKRALNNTKPPTNEELQELNTRLTQNIITLNKIDDEQLEEEKTKLYKEINFYSSQIQQRMMVNEEPATTEETNQVDQQQIEAQIIASVERKIEEIRPEILVFVGLETSKKFFELDETLIRSTLKLDDVRPDKGSESHNNKIKLLKLIHQYSDILDARVKQTEDIEDFEKTVNEILIKIDLFNGHLGDPEYSNLDEQIIELKVKLGKFDANEQLIVRKEACLKEVDNCMKKLKEAAQINDGMRGTLV